MTNKKAKKTKSKPLEVQAFIKHSSELHEALNDGVMTRLAWDLFSAEIFSDATRSNITNNSNISENERASKFVSALGKVIKSNNTKFTVTLGKCYGYLELKPVVTRILQEYETLKDVCPGFKAGKHVNIHSCS